MSHLRVVVPDATCGCAAGSIGPQVPSRRPGAGVSRGPRAVQNKVNISIKAQLGVCPHHLRASSITHGGWSRGQQSRKLSDGPCMRDEARSGKAPLVHAWLESSLLPAF